MSWSRRTFLATATGMAGGLVLGGPNTMAARRQGAGIEPFTIDFGRAAVDDLHRRLDATRWPEFGFDTGWEAGTNAGVVRDLARYWRDDYDWFAVQDELNTLPHFRATIEGDRLHFVHLRAENPIADFPILLLHGWPGSFYEFVEALPLLQGFDLVIPSLPGFVFSDAPSRPGVHAGQMRERIQTLMTALGYERYGLQGGDWGAAIAMEIARATSNRVAGLHINFCVEAPSPPDGEAPSEAEQEYRQRAAAWQANEYGYFEIQGTRPQTLAFGLTDSPVGLLAWMLEKFWAWSDHGEDLWETFTRDQILTAVSLYWFTGNALSASRIYYEQRRRSSNEAPPQGRIEVPTGYAHFPGEPWGPPREIVERVANLVHYTRMPAGGHFAAFEQPGLWAADVRRFFSGVR